MLAVLAYVLLKDKAAPKGNVDIGEPTIGTSPNEWQAYPYRRMVPP